MSTLDNRSDVHFNYPLKPSRMAKLFQWGCLLIILFVVYQIHTLSIFLSIAVLSGGTLYFRLKKSTQQLVLLSHLDQSDWSVQYVFPAQVKQIQIDKILDYQCFFVISVKQSGGKDLLVWYDQLQRNSLKSLKARAKLK